MKAKLIYGQRYRATVELPPLIRPLVTADLVVSELAPYHLRNARVAETDTGFLVEADYLGRTGSYDLPEQVQAVEHVGPIVKLRA